MRCNILNIKQQNDLPVVMKERGINISLDSIRSPRDIRLCFEEIYRVSSLLEEYVYLVCFRSTKLLGIFEISHGGINISHVAPGSIFLRLLLIGSTDFLLVHNHPSGNCYPSKEDREITEIIKKIAQMHSINFLDHIILSDVNEYSFMRDGKL